LFDLTKGNEQVMTEMFGRMEPLVAIFALLGPQAETYTKKLTEMKRSTGSMNEAFKVQTTGINKVGFAWDRFKIKLTLVRQELGDRLGPTFEKVLGYLGNFLKYIQDLTPETKKFLMILAGITAIIGPILLVLSPIITAMGSILTSISLLAMAGGSLAGFATIFIALLPLVAAIAFAFAGIGAAILQIIIYWKDLKKMFLESPFGFLVDLLSFMTGGLLPAIQDFKNLWGSITGGKVKSNDIEFERAKQLAAQRLSSGSAVAAIGVQKSETDINIKVSADAGTTATVRNVKSKGNVKPNIATVGYVGASQ